MQALRESNGKLKIENGKWNLPVGRQEWKMKSVLPMIGGFDV